jgi:predicted short-subunit dehydrogenase-like oxidoreductase (DUF2520 family)
MTSLKKLTITIAGAGNVGRFLAVELFAAGCDIRQIYNRTQSPAVDLAGKVNSEPVSDITGINPDVDLIILALPDRVIPVFCQKLAVEGGIAANRTIIASTAGSVGLKDLNRHFSRCGVIYPLQTFTRYTKPNSAIIPFCIEGADYQVAAFLRETASLISGDVRDIDSNQRLVLHLAAVFACNFTNHMIAVADEIIRKANLDFSILLPLINETIKRLEGRSPLEMQTGPAVRDDKNTIEKHLQLLSETEGEILRSLYAIASESIAEMKKN